MQFLPSLVGLALLAALGSAAPQTPKPKLLYILLDGWVFILFICMYMWVFICMYVWVFICMYVWVFICMYMWVFICMDIYMHVYVCIYKKILPSAVFEEGGLQIIL